MMKLPRPIDVVSAATIRPIINESFDLPLGSEGFVRVDNRKWVRRRTPDIADLFQLQDLKASRYSPVWGFAINFVPHILGGRLYSHNANKTAILDYRYDPLDVDYGSDAQYEAWFINRLFGMRVAQQDAQRSAAIAIPLALDLFSQVEGISDLGQLFARSLAAHRSGTTYRFGFFNYTQFPIAYAFILAKLGKLEDGVSVLNEAVAQGIDYGAVLEKLVARMKRLAESQTQDA